MRRTFHISPSALWMGPAFPGAQQCTVVVPCAFERRALAGRLAGPALEGMREGADVLMIAKQPCNLRNRQVPVGQMAICEVGSEIVSEKASPSSDSRRANVR